MDCFPLSPVVSLYATLQGKPLLSCAYVLHNTIALNSYLGLKLVALYKRVLLCTYKIDKGGNSNILNAIRKLVPVSNFAHNRKAQNEVDIFSQLGQSYFRIPLRQS